jgi:predicted lipoprotein with Yx(FWY)xxD motif
LPTKPIVALTPVLIALAVGACGSSGQSHPHATASNTAGTASRSTATQASSSSSGGGYGYGSSAPASSATATSAMITTKHSGKLGTVLAFGPRRLTVYLFEADHGGHSACAGPCAAAWPPVTGTPKAAGGAIRSDLGTITRPDGTKQVTYKGHPLYRFAKDKDDGDAYGEGVKAFGAEWYVLAPSGAKVDES